MEKQPKPITNAIQELKNNLSGIARVYEWAELMGYSDPKTFGEHFLQHFDVRPHKAMDCIRLKSIISYLRSNRSYSNHKIAQEHSLPNEKALNNYINYHLGYPPTQLRSMPKEELGRLFENLGGKIQE